MSRGLTEPAGLDAAADAVRRLTGLTFPASRRGALETAVRKAMERARTRDLADYLARLASDQDLLDDLTGDLTVGESYFFRSPEQFDLIASAVLGARTPRDRPLRLWSAGCAAGEEAYTLAILLHQRGLTALAHILATDLSRGSLAKARRASYTRWSLRGVPDDVVAAYFRCTGDHFDLVPAVRNNVEFRYLNLAEDTYPSLAAGVWGMDLIVCRNVLIYLDAETVAHVARRLIASLGDDGWLVLGPSDPSISGLAGCEAVVTPAGLAYRRAAAAAPSLLERRGPDRPHRPVPAIEPRPAPPPDTPAEVDSVIGVAGGEPSRTAEPTEATLLADAVRCYGEQDYARAAELAKAAAGRSDTTEAWVLLVRALANAGRLNEAGLACASALDRHRISAELAYLHGILLAEGGHTAEAIVAARAALYLDRGLVVAHFSLGTALARSGERRGARRAFRNAADLLEALPPQALVPCSDGERADRLLQMARAGLSLLADEAA